MFGCSSLVAARNSWAKRWCSSGCSASFTVSSFTATVANIAISLAVRRVARFRPFLLIGSVLYLLATCVMLKFRTQEASVPVLVAAQAALASEGEAAAPTGADQFLAFLEADEPKHEAHH